MIKNKRWSMMVVLLLLATIFVTACGNNSGSSNSTSNTGSNNQGASSTPAATVENLPAALAEKGDINIKVIRLIGGDDHTAQYLAGAKQEGESLGFKVNTFSADGDAVKFLEALDQAANEKLDAVIISHGNVDGTYDAVKKLRDKGIEVVAFDSIESLAEIPGVTVTSQADESLAQFALDHLVEDFSGEAKIVYLWVDGFPAMVRRNTIYQDVLSKNPGIVEVERFGVATDNTSVDTQNAVATILAKYPKGEIDAIFATWDAFAIGAHRALVEAGRTEIKIYGIDVSNADLQAIQEENSPWVSTAAVDPKLIGAVNLRLAALKLAGEETPTEYSLDANIIKQADLKGASEPVNMQGLGDIINGWGQSDAFLTDWMTALKEANK